MALEIDSKSINDSLIKDSFMNMSSEEDEPIQIRRTSTKKRINLSDDDSDRGNSDLSSNNIPLTDKNDHSEQSLSSSDETQVVKSAKHTSKTKLRRVVAQKDSDDSGDDDSPSEKPSQLSDEEEKEDQGASQRKMMERLRSDNYDADSSEDDSPGSARNSSMIEQSEDDQKKNRLTYMKKSAPKKEGRKSAAACMDAMKKERLKIASESQRMLREAQAYLPYHKPKQRSLQEFLKARPKSSVPLRKTHAQNIDILLVGKELEERANQAEEFYKAESEEEEEKQQSHTPPLQSFAKSPSKPEALQAGISDFVIEPNKLEDIPITSINTENMETQTTMDMDSNKENTIKTLEAVKKRLLDTFDTLDENMDSTNLDPPKVIPETNTCSEDISDDPLKKVDNPKVNGLQEVPLISEEFSKPNTMENSPILESVDSGICALPETCLTDTSVTQDGTSNIKNIKTQVESKSLHPVILSADISDACLTPSDASDNKELFLVPGPTASIKPVELESDTQDSLDDLHLYLADSEELSATKGDEIKTEAKVENNETNPKFDLEKLYNATDMLSSDDEDCDKPKIDITNEKEKLFASLKMQSGPVRLKSFAGEIIDLDEDVKVNQDGVEDLMNRFIRHATAGSKNKTKKQEGLMGLMLVEEKSEKIDHDVKPGAKMKLLRSEFQKSIAKQRDEEFNRRQKQYQIYEEETGGENEEGGCKVLSEDEEDPFADLENELNGEGDTESEPELEDDVVLKDTPREKNILLDDEAEESDQEENEEEEREENDEEEEEEDDEADEDIADNEETETEEIPEDTKDEVFVPIPTIPLKKAFQRIKRIDSDDDDDSEIMDQNVAETISDVLSTNDTPVIPTSLMQGSTNHEMKSSLNLSFLHNSFTDSPSSKLNFDNSVTDDVTIPSTPGQNEYLPKDLGKLLQGSESVGNLADMCSGQFPETLEKNVQGSGLPKGLEKFMQRSDSAPDMAALCSGQFITQEDKTETQGMSKLFEISNTPDDLAGLCSGQFPETACLGMSKELGKLLEGHESVYEDIADLCSGKFTTQVELLKSQSQELVKDEEIKQLKSTSPDVKQEIKSNIKNSPYKMMMEMEVVPSDEEDGEPAVGLKKRKGKRKLAFSDDEDDSNEEEDGSDIESEEEKEEAEKKDIDLDDEGGFVDYDSEENEIVMAPGQMKSAKQFFDAEAELSESEWGSADEDEKDLDQLEMELGDEDDLDQNILAKELGKIHARRMLDEDKRDVRLFQEAFLEDGDLHSEGGGRQRLYRWKNIDNANWPEGSSQKNHSGDEGMEDDEEESTFRTARLERETWLLENKDKVAADAVAAESNSTLLVMGRSLMARMTSTRKAAKSKPPEQAQPPSAAVKKFTTSPGKILLQSLKRKSGSFLARRSISMTRMVALTGGETDGSMVNSKNNRNFVFSTISPTSEKGAAVAAAEASEEDSPKAVPTKKRVAAPKPAPRQSNAKKFRVSSSVFQLM